MSIMGTKPANMGARRRESEMEHRTRKERKFDETESKLPDVKLSALGHDRPDIATNFLSYLGSWNPMPIQVSENDTVWLFDNISYRNPKTNSWEGEFVAAVFDKGTGVQVSTVVADVAEKLGLGSGDEAETRIKERLMPFMQSTLPGRVVKVDFGDKQLKLGPGGRNGISSDVRALPSHQDGEVVTSVANVQRGANGMLQMKTFYAEPEGWGVISGMQRFLDQIHPY